MIIFYKRSTGEIVGTVEGRLHPEHHLKISMQNSHEAEIGKFIVTWKPVQFYNRQGKIVPPTSKTVYTADYVPNHKSQYLFQLFEKEPQKIREYKVVEDRNGKPVDLMRIS
jgi:hypothetical protein